MFAAQDRQSFQIKQDVFPYSILATVVVRAARKMTTGPSHAGCMDTNRASQPCDGPHVEGGGLAIGQELSAAVC